MLRFFCFVVYINNCIIVSAIQRNKNFSKMNTQTTELLKQLADKLGTTTQYLWSVLLHQAPVDATITLIQMIIGLLVIVVTSFFHKKFNKEYIDPYYSDGKHTTTLYKENEGAIAMIVILGVASLIIVIVIICNIGTVINGYFNPEYWALDKIISTAKGN